MPRSRASAEHQEAVSRRLALLSAELSGLSETPGASRTTRPPGAEGVAEPVSVVTSTIPVVGRHAARRGRPRGDRDQRGPGVAGRDWPARDRAARDWAARFALEPRHWLVVGLAVALGLAGTGWWLLRARPSEPVPAPLPASALVTPAPAAGSTAGTADPSAGATAPPGSAASPSGEVVVDVAGRVRRPGIAVLSTGARVVDAIEAAGGVRPGVDLGSLNLARLLLDGEQLLVGVRQPDGPGAVAGAGPASTASGSPPAALVNLNTADQTTLEGLPEVGPVTAQAIIAWRTEHGGFTSVDQLVDVDGIGEVTMRQIAPLVTI